MDDPRRKTGSVTVDVSPTFISTDLLTPGSAHLRVTLPAIAKFSRPVQQLGRWGTVTVCNVTPTRVDVTHRRYGCGCFNFVAPYQPYQLTPLMLSRCRRNDQMLFSPEKGIMHDKQILLPFPQQDPNAAHVSKLSIFPNPFDSQPNSTTSTERERILKSLEQSLYCKTGYSDTYRAHHATQYVKPSLPPLNETATPISYQHAQDQADCTNSTKVTQNLITIPDDDVDESNDKAEENTTNDNDTMDQIAKTNHDKGTQTNKRDLLIDTTTSNTCILLLTTQRGCQTGTAGSYHHQGSTDTLLNGNTFDISNTQSGGRKRPLMSDASTQTVVLMSLVRKTKHDSPMTSSKYTKTFPVLPSIKSIPRLDSIAASRRATKSSLHHPQEHCKLSPCYHYTDPILTARFKAQLKYNEEFVEFNGSDSCEKNNLCLPLSRRSAKKMSFYGEHTSIFR